VIFTFFKDNQTSVKVLINKAVFTKALLQIYPKKVFLERTI